MSIKAYAYSRYSSAAQAQGDSLRRQLKASIEFADDHGLDLDTTLRDLGVSAYTGANRVKGALGSFVARVERGEIARGSYLLVDSMDRLSRESETEVLHLLTGLTRKGIKVVNLSEKHILDEKAEVYDYMRVLIHASRSNQESKEKGRKVGEARAVNKARARDEMFRWNRNCPNWMEAHQEGKGEHRVITFTVVPERVKVVKQIYDMAEKGLGTAAIAQRLNNAGQRTFRQNKPWQPSVLMELLRARTVLGEYQPKFAMGGGVKSGSRPNDGDPIPNYYEPIIDPAQFYRVQQIIADRTTRPKGRANGPVIFTNLFVGLGRCGECGGTFGIQYAKKRSGKPAYQALRCINAANAASGPLKALPCTNKKRHEYTRLEASILKHITQFELPTEKRPESPSVELARAEAELVELNQKVENLLDMLEQGDDRMKARYEQRTKELAAKELEVRALRIGVESAHVAPPVQARAEALQGLVAKLNEAEGAELYDLRATLSQELSRVIDHMTFYPDGEATVMIGGGWAAFLFRDGELVRRSDLSNVYGEASASELERMKREAPKDPDQFVADMIQEEFLNLPTA